MSGRTQSIGLEVIRTAAVVNGGITSKVSRVECDDCGKTFDIADPNYMPRDQMVRKFAEKGWKVDRRRRSVLCPECQDKQPKSNASSSPLARPAKSVPAFPLRVGITSNGSSPNSRTIYFVFPKSLRSSLMGDYVHAGLTPDGRLLLLFSNEPGVKVIWKNTSKHNAYVAFGGQSENLTFAISREMIAARTHPSLTGEIANNCIVTREPLPEYLLFGNEDQMPSMRKEDSCRRMIDVSSDPLPTEPEPTPPEDERVMTDDEAKTLVGMLNGWIEWSREQGREIDIRSEDGRLRIHAKKVVIDEVMF